MVQPLANAGMAQPVADRRGADSCPGALVVHQAEDGGLARIRVPGGLLTRDVLAGMAGWAQELGNGRLELTARGNVQLRGLPPGAELELSDRLAEHGLLPSATHDRARNVLASPLSGRDGAGALDVHPVVRELDRRLCADPALARLPGRFLFALDDGRGDVAGPHTDVAALAVADQRVVLLLGGVDTGLRVPVHAVVTALLQAAAVFLRRRPDERTWRVAELPGGPLELVEELAEVLRGAPGADVRTGPAVSVPERDRVGPIGPIAQTDGRVALAVSVPLGELTPARCRVLASLAERDVVLTPWRGVVLPDLPRHAVGSATRRLAGAGLLLDPAAPELGVTACTGRPGCAKALSDVRADALVAAGHAAGTVVGPRPAGGAAALLPVHWSGCSRRCGRPVGPAVDVVAEPDGYRVLRDGQLYYAGADLAGVRAATAQARAGR